MLMSVISWGIEMATVRAFVPSTSATMTSSGVRLLSLSSAIQPTAAAGRCSWVRCQGRGAAAATSASSISPTGSRASPFLFYGHARRCLACMGEAAEGEGEGARSCSLMLFSNCAIASCVEYTYSTAVYLLFRKQVFSTAVLVLYVQQYNKYPDAAFL